jgi:hypothetical protein
MQEDNLTRTEHRHDPRMAEHRIRADSSRDEEEFEVIRYYNS